MAEIRITNGLILSDIQEEVKKFECQKTKTMAVEIVDSKNFKKWVRIYEPHIVEQIKRLKLHRHSHVNALIEAGEFAGNDGKSYPYYKLLRIEIFSDAWGSGDASAPRKEPVKKEKKEENGLYSCLNALNDNPFN